MRVRPQYKLDDIMQLTHRQIVLLLEEDRPSGGKIPCASYEDAVALQKQLRASEAESDG